VADRLSESDPPHRGGRETEDGMIGVICGRDILAHPIVTIRCFGWRTFFQALFAGRRRTFLSLLQQAGRPQESAAKLPALVDRCIELELRARRVYAAFARAFAAWPTAGQFFDTVARQEQEHAELLSLCRAAARGGDWPSNCANPWEDYVPCLQRHMDEIEAALPQVGSLDDAFRLLVQIEAGEINRVFQGVLTSCNSDFVKRVGAFRKAVRQHVSYIAKRLPELDARQLSAARELRILFLGERS
jgi:hypothetical protein